MYLIPLLINGALEKASKGRGGGEEVRFV